MAKSRPQKPHSRAAKRAASPPIEIAVARPASPTVPEKIAALGVRGDSGVSKKKKKQKPMSRAQKERKAAAMDKAEAALEKLEKKRESSKGRAKVVQSRRGGWEELNEKVMEELDKAEKLAILKVE